jgi:hypothetical protein
VGDRTKGQFLGGEERKAAREVEAHLMTKHRPRADAGAIMLLNPISENAFQQVMVLPHRRNALAVAHAPDPGIFRCKAAP